MYYEFDMGLIAVGLTGVTSFRIFQKLSLWPIELLAKTEPISHSSSTSVITQIRRGRKSCSQLQSKVRSESMWEKLSWHQGQWRSRGRMCSRHQSRDCPAHGEDHGEADCPPPAHEGLHTGAGGYTQLRLGPYGAGWWQDLCSVERGAYIGAVSLEGLIPTEDPHWSSLFLKDNTPWKGPTPEQFTKNCSPWEWLTLEKFIKNCLRGRDMAEICDELTTTSSPHPPVPLWWEGCREMSCWTRNL